LLKRIKLFYEINAMEIYFRIYVGSTEMIDNVQNTNLSDLHVVVFCFLFGTDSTVTLLKWLLH
jgi:hypothetical protein